MMPADEPAGATVPPAASEEDVSRLLRLAGRRMDVPETATARVREAARCSGASCCRPGDGDESCAWRR